MSITSQRWEEGWETKKKERERREREKKQTSFGRDLARSPEHFVLTQESWEGYANGPVE